MRQAMNVSFFIFNFESNPLSIIQDDSMEMPNEVAQVPPRKKRRREVDPMPEEVSKQDINNMKRFCILRMFV